MKKFISVTLCTVLLAGLLCGCCFHKSLSKATCTTDEVCEKCGEVLEKAFGHTPDRKAADCENAQVCTVCERVLNPALGHTPDNGNPCTEDIYCTVCGHLAQKKTRHKPNIKKATCTEEQACTVCKKVIKKALGHTSKKAATATSAEICTWCGLWITPPLASGLGTPKINTNEITEETAAEGSFIPETEKGKHYIKGGIAESNDGMIKSCGNYMFESFSVSKNGSAEYADSISRFAKKYKKLNVCCMIVPKCSSFHAPEEIGDLSKNHKSFIDATYKQIRGAKTINAYGEMKKHLGEYLFYRTDHHWTSLGAYYASVAFCKANEIKPRRLDSYKTVVNTDFLGTLYTTFWSGTLPNGIESDYTVAHMPKTDYILTYTNDENAYEGTAYGSAIRQSAKNYAYMFLNGDVALTHIATSAKSDRRLLIFKESYGNAFAPYMIDYFKEIVVVDIRHSEPSTEKLIKQHKITDVLIINNIQAVGGLKGLVKERLES